VVGPEFAAHAVAGAAPTGSDLGDVEVVEQLCDMLAGRQELLRAAGERVSPDGTTSARYAFRHALYQQVIDQSLTPSQRRRLHQRIGERLEASHAGNTDDVASALAAHFERSGDMDRAVRYHGEAAAQARRRFSYQETRLHVEAALRLMRGRPETTEAIRRQAGMLDDLGWASVASRGWGDEEAARAFALMRELVERLDAAKARFNALEGELTVHTMRAEYAIARQRGEEMLLLAEQVGDPMAIAAALSSLGAAMLQLGEIESAAEIGERGRALADPLEPTLYAISCCSLIACSSALRGLVDRARAMNRECVGLAAKGDVPLFRAYAAIFSAAVSKLMLDVATTRSLAEEAVRIARDLGFSVVADTATIYLAWCDVQDGRVDEGVDGLGAAFDAYLASGQRIGTSSYSLPVIEGYLAAGDVRRASELLDKMLAFIAETGERIVEPEIHRLMGECLLAGAAAHGRRTDAIACFERAIALAEAQNALLFELRAATSLYRVRPKATRERLTRLVARFAPKDDCVDLRAAAALLGS
jgi:adenylate cyclase